MSEITLSFCIPTYNRGEIVFKNILNILRCPDPDIEVVVLDNGSTDNTLATLQNVAVLDKRIKIIGYKENKGLSNALNYCLTFSKGKYIARMDADDISYQNRFEKQIAFLYTYPDSAKNTGIIKVAIKNMRLSPIV